MPATCKLDNYMTICEDRDVLDLDELDFYAAACSCEDCASIPPVVLSEDPALNTISLAS